jgi:tetratricopeptide (TPR) repeat protein
MRSRLHLNRWLVISWAALSATAFSPAHAADTPEVAQPTVNERLTTAREAIKAKDWRKALAELNVAARDEPRNADVQNLLGYSYRMQAQPNLPKSFEHYKKALAIDPKHKNTHHYVGMAYLMDKKPADSERHLAELQKVCGNTTCPEYLDLSRAIAQFKTSGTASSGYSAY